MSRGAVYGLVGANGAGKTTLIKHVLGLLRAESGSVRVFGLDPVADPVAVLSRIGYLSEENDLPGWMRVEKLIRYSRAFWPLVRALGRVECPMVFARSRREAPSTSMQRNSVSSKVDSRDLSSFETRAWPDPIRRARSA